MANDSGKKKRAQAARAEAKAKKAKRDMLIVGGAVSLIAGGILVAAVLFGGSDTGITTSTAWDLPALQGDTDGDGEDDRFTLEEFAGQPLVVNFFASWCTNCENELPRFKFVDEQFADRLNVVYVNSNETGDWEPMAERTGILDGRLIKDINGSNGNGLYRSLGGTGGMPLTAFYDAEGTVVHIDRGELSSEELQVRLIQFFDIVP